MSSSTAAAGTTISQAPTPRPTAPAHDAHRTADLGRPRGRRSWSDFAEAELAPPSPR